MYMKLKKGTRPLNVDQGIETSNSLKKESIEIVYN